MYALAGEGDGSTWNTTSRTCSVSMQETELHALNPLFTTALKGMTITISHLMQFLMSQQPRGGGEGRGKKSLEFKIQDSKPGQILEKSQTVSEYTPSCVL